ncbi:MAG: hypothetical protein FJZ47_12900, partial [Candidatus Tectomicrobia bacterium]|nr:hypothetical protein [Candidatus Tectomicrobia bacterium]
MRQRLGPLGALQGGGNLRAIAYMLGLDYQQGNDIALGRNLEAVGLGTLLLVGQEITYLRLHPALAQAMWGTLPETQRRTAQATWAMLVRALIGFLYEQQCKDTRLAAHL